MKVRNMTEGKALPLLLSVALPLMAGNVFQQLYNVVDAQVVGVVEGVEALAALGSTSWYHWLFFGMVMGFTEGFTIPMAQFFGADRFADLRRCIGNSIVLVLIVVLLIATFAIVTMPAAMGFMEAPVEIRPLASAYMNVIFAALPISAAYNLMSGILRAMGNGKTPLYAMILASVVNVVLDILFVAVLHWGVKGAAIATAIAQLASCVFCFLNLRKVDIIHLSREDFRIDFKLARRLFGLSLPMSLQNSIIGLGGIVVQRIVNTMGVSFLAGHTATNKLYGILEIATSSYGYAVSTYAGQNFGAGKHDRVRHGVHVAAVVGVVTALIVAAFMFLFGRSMLSSFITGTPEQVETALNVGTEYLHLMSACLPVLYLLYVYRSSLQGLGNTVMPMISGFTELVVRVTAVLVLPDLIGYKGVLWAEVLAWMGADVILVPSYYYTVSRKRMDRAK